jgi:hypothetical protein
MFGCRKGTPVTYGWIAGTLFPVIRGRKTMENALDHDRSVALYLLAPTTLADGK